MGEVATLVIRLRRPTNRRRCMRIGIPRLGIRIAPHITLVRQVPQYIIRIRLDPVGDGVRSTGPRQSRQGIILVCRRTKGVGPRAIQDGGDVPQGIIRIPQVLESGTPHTHREGGRKGVCTFGIRLVPEFDPPGVCGTGKWEGGGSEDLGSALVDWSGRGEGLFGRVPEWSGEVGGGADLELVCGGEGGRTGIRMDRGESG